MQEQILMRISNQLEEIARMIGTQRKEHWGKVGRPTKEHVVRKYRKKYPDSWKMQCVRTTGLSIKTVSKYWDMIDEEERRGEDNENKIEY